MGVTRADLFNEQQNEIATIAKAFAHPARVAIIQHLLKANTCINGDLVQELGLAQATISQHLRELKEVGLIKGTIEGVSISYCIDSEKWESVNKLFDKLFDAYSPSCEDNCC
jgi:predicted transcriptional regulator